MNKLRIGRRMWEIDEVLSEAKKPMTLTEIIMKIKGLTPYREYSDICKRKIRKCGLELASAIIQQNCAEEQYTVDPHIILARMLDPTNPKNEEMYQNSKAEGQQILNAIKEADKLYALYTRSIKLLHQSDWVVAGAYRYDTFTCWYNGGYRKRTHAEIWKKKMKSEEYRNCRTYQLVPHLKKLYKLMDLQKSTKNKDCK